MYTENLDQYILIRPAETKKCNSLKIVTGYTDIECITRHLIALSEIDGLGKVFVEMILGMTSNKGLTEKKHKDILNLISRISDDKGMPHFSCRYKFKGEDIHSKVYIWCKDEKPAFAFCGSANYSMNAFHKRREAMEACDATEALGYYNSLLCDTISCNDSTLASKLHFSKSCEKSAETDEFNIENLSWEMFAGKTPIDECTVSLLMANEEGTGFGSGLNWGIRKDGTKREHDQAYIPYNAKNRKDGFFPLKKKPSEKNNPIFKVVPNGFDPFFMRIAQQGNKGIQTAESNSLLGQFFRKKLGVPSGTFITKEMLENYGKTYVVFRKYREDLFTLEF